MFGNNFVVSMWSDTINSGTLADHLPMVGFIDFKNQELSNSHKLRNYLDLAFTLTKFMNQTAGKVYFNAQNRTKLLQFSQAHFRIC